MADFRHRPKPVPFMHHCSTKRAVLLLGPNAWLENGAGICFPDDPVISSRG
jgi:hypothetical protein